MIVQFPVFIQPCTQKRLIMYQIETVPVPILDENEQVHSYTELKIEKPYIALNEETYIMLHSQELKMCKRIGYKYYCKELFVIKSKSTSAIYFNLEIRCDKGKLWFQYYYNKTDIKPTVLNGWFQIILANWPNYRKIMCSHNNNIPINIPGHPYILMNWSILCNCDIEAESNYLLESLAACEGPDAKTDLEMHVTVNLAFMNYFKDILENLGKHISLNWTTQEQILPISLETFEISPNLINAPKTSLTVQEINFCKSIQNLRPPSFFWTSTTALTKRLFEHFIAPYVQHLLKVFPNLFKLMWWNPTVPFFEMCAVCKFKGMFYNGCFVQIQIT